MFEVFSILTGFYIVSFLMNLEELGYDDVDFYIVAGFFVNVIALCITLPFRATLPYTFWVVIGYDLVIPLIYIVYTYIKIRVLKNNLYN